MRSAFRRVPVQAATRQRSDVKTFPPPTRGLVKSEALATPEAGGAEILRNWRPTQNGCVLRGGSVRHATLGERPILSLMSYDAGGVRKFFAATGPSIFEITAPASPTVAPDPSVTGLTGGDFTAALMTTAGASFLVAVNGADDMRVFDGAAWSAINDASSPAITGVDTDTFSHAWVYRSRLFFVQRGTLLAWYLPVDSIGGEALSVSLAGIFQMGGSLLFGATWSLDAGDGIDDKIVFVSDQGEAAIYEGSDPGSADDWNLVGVYQIGRPLGRHATMKAGGDLLIATQEGLVPISAAISKDLAALSLASVSRKIAPLWSQEASSRPLPWEMVKWTDLKVAYVTLPAQPAQSKGCLVVNVETGAWGQYDGWDTRCFGLFNGRVYFGTSDGRVMLAENGGNDDGKPYDCVVAGLFDHYGKVGQVKNFQMARATFRATQPFNAELSCSVNYDTQLPTEPPPAANELGDQWDVGLWDVARWDSGSIVMVTSKWVSLGRTGFVGSWQIQVTCDMTVTPDAELVAVDVTYQAAVGNGGVVV